LNRLPTDWFDKAAPCRWQTRRLLHQLDALLAHAGRSETMGMEAYGVFQMNRGAVDKTLRVIEGFL